tara:strand:+ start:1794 stop:1967 length:174 start_codon:yes stop_codon:yes gene_type:complete
MGFAFKKEVSKPRVSGYQKLKQEVDTLEQTLLSMIERPHSSEAKGLKQIFKIKHDLE